MFVFCAVDGFQLFFEREVPIELRSATSVNLPTEVRSQGKCTCGIAKQGIG